jgi:ribosomal protein S6
LSHISYMAETHEDKDVVLSTYELGYHLVPSLSEDDLALRVGELMKLVTENGGNILSEGAPEPFTLAYTMKRLRGGKWEKYDTSFFGWVRFEAPAEALPVVKEVLEQSEYLVRHLILKLDAKALAPAPEPRKPQPVELKEVETEPKQLEKKQDKEEDKGEVQEEELDKQIEDLIK